MKLLADTIAAVVEGPTFERQTEDGPVATHQLFVMVQAEDGEFYTHTWGFEQHERLGAQALADRVSERGCINPELWWQGTVWDGVKAEVQLANEYAAMGANEGHLEAMGLA